MNIRSSFRRFTGLVILAALLLVPPSAFAHKRDFVWTYEWFTPAKSEMELELWARTRPESHKTQTQVELEFAITDRWVVSPYFVHETERGKPAKNGWKLEQRYRFGDLKRYRLLPAAYLEVKKMSGDEYVGEAKAIVSYLGRNFNFAANLIVEKELVAGAKRENAYAVGWSTRLSRNLVGGIELFGDLQVANPAAGPTFGIDLADNQRLCVGAAFGLTGRAEDLSARVIYEYEWFN